MTLIRFAPADVFEEVRHEMEEMLNEFRRKESDTRKFNGTAPVWKPRVDVRESDEALWFAVEMPGMDKNDIHVSFDDFRHTVDVGIRTRVDQRLRGSRLYKFDKLVGLAILIAIDFAIKLMLLKENGVEVEKFEKLHIVREYIAR